MSHVTYTSNPILKVKDLKKWFPVRYSILDVFLSGQKYVKAVDGINFEVKRGETFGLVGESGCGKTTTGRLIAKLIEPTDGEVLFEDINITSSNDRKILRKIRKEIQMVFQDPYESLSPRRKIYDLLVEPLQIHKITEKKERVLRVLEDAGLPTSNDFLTRRPLELSGGQRQRVMVARALMLNPKFLIADEPVSMLDASVRGEILNLLFKLKQKLNLSCLFITHDLSVAWHMCDRIGVMYLGEIVEKGLIEQIIRKPAHPYTKALVSAIPTLDISTKCYEKIDKTIKGEIPDPTDPPTGCRFHPRCPYAKKECSKVEPRPLKVEENHYVACHLYG